MEVDRRAYRYDIYMRYGGLGLDGASQYHICLQKDVHVRKSLHRKLLPVK
jgi:hypothetical protein